MSVDTHSSHGGENILMASLNCLSALMSVDTAEEGDAKAGRELGLNCLSALMSVDTDVRADMDANIAIWSQLPFGFDVG